MPKLTCVEMGRLGLLAVVLFLLPPILFSQNWVVRFNGNADSTDYAKSINVMPSGISYITGSSMDSVNGYNIVTIKYETSGEMLWISNYDGPEHLYDIAVQMEITGSDDIYIVGGTQVSPLPQPRYDVALLKYDTLGNLIWTTQYDAGLDETEYPYSMALNSSHDRIYVAATGKSPYTDNDILVLAYNSNGELLWVDRFNGTDSLEDYAHGVTVDEWGNIYVTGSIRNLITHDDVVTIKYSAFGVRLWTAYYEGFLGSDFGLFITTDLDGNVIVTGKSQNQSYNYDFITLKYDTLGNLIWAKRYDSNAMRDEIPAALEVDEWGNIYVTGKSGGIGEYDDIVTIKYSPDGDELWIATYEGNSPYSVEDSRGMELTPDGNIYITGFTDGFTGTNDILLIKYDTCGILKWAVHYNAPDSLSDFGEAMGVDSAGYIYVVGTSEGVETQYDYITLKYPSVPFINETDFNPPLNSSIKVHPNPFRNSIFIICPNRNILNIHDVTGRKIRVLKNSSGTFKWDGRDMSGKSLPSGTYFFKYGTELKKVVLIR